MGLFTEMMEEAGEQSHRIAVLEARVRELETDLAWEQARSGNLALEVTELRSKVIATHRHFTKPHKPFDE